MSPPAIPAATLELSGELHALLRKIDPATFRDEVEPEARAELASIVDRVGSLCRASSQPEITAGGGTTAVLSQKLSQLLAALDRAQRIETAPARAYWAAFQREVHPAYESLADWLRSSAMAAPSLRPTNYARNLFHLGSALAALLVIVLAPTPRYITLAAMLFFASAWTMETARRLRPQVNERLMALFGKLAHVHERYRVNSATWYATALMLLSLWSSSAVSAIAVVVLGVGDPVAAMVGRRFGRTRLRAGRSLEGSLGFVGSAFVVAWVVAVLLLPGSLSAHLLIALVAAISGAVAEIFSTRLDDNLTIPLSVAASVTALQALLR